MVTRLTAQKGVDLVLPVVPFLDRIPLQLAVLGAGERPVADGLRAAQPRPTRDGLRSARATTNGWPTGCSRAVTCSSCRAGSNRAGSPRCSR